MAESEKIKVKVDPDLKDLIPDFLQFRQDDIVATRGFLARGDFDSIKMLGHSMKGSGGGYGFYRITDIGAVIETAAKSKDVAAIERQVMELEDYLSRVEITYG